MTSVEAHDGDSVTTAAERAFEPVAARLLSRELPGTGGRLRSEHTDFRVEEIPAYAASGVGDHIFLTFTKDGLNTHDAVTRIAGALGVAARDIGVAGLKDRHAITTQTISLPPPITPEAALAIVVPGLALLSAVRHNHKLRTGHLKGNRFTLIARGLACDVDTAVSRARAIFDCLSQAPGLPNWYGEQRFGRDSQNAAAGWRLLTTGQGPRDPSRRRLLASALQSELFNRALAARIDAGLFTTALLGDVLKKTDTGGLFDCADTETDTARLRAGQVVPTGPMFGPKMRATTPGSPAEAWERSVLGDLGLDAVPWDGRLAEGTRRPLAVTIESPVARACDDVPDALELAFTLPKGSYATCVWAELAKTEGTP